MAYTDQNIDENDLFSESFVASNPDLALAQLEKDEEKDDNGLTGGERAKIIKDAQKAARDAKAYWSDQYDEMLTDWEFYDGTDNKQWTQKMLDKRRGRPIRTINQLPKFVARVVAETKKNPPAIKLSPRESGDRLKAQIGSGLIRFIEDSCGAKYTYTNALESAVIGGFGFIRVSFNANGKILIKKVKDVFNWYIDPDSEEGDGSDAQYFVRTYKKKNGKKQVDCFEYWWAEGDPDDNERKVFWAIIEGNDVCEYGEFPSRIIPVFPVMGTDLQYDGERTVKGLVRDMRDPQASYNFMKSVDEETLAMTPKPFALMEEGTIAGLEGDYRRAGINVVEYKTTNSRNLAAAPPNLAPLQTGASAITANAVSGAMQDMREVSGIYDSALGAPTSELSGKAILAKQGAADAGQFQFTENLQKTLAQVGRCLMQMIKPIMGDNTSIRILGEDGVMSMVDLGVPQVDPTTGQPVELDLDFSDMDISITSGPAYATRREAASQTFQDIIKALPETGSVLADLAVGNLDAPGAEEGARRLKLMLPPQLQEQKPGDQMPADQLQAQLAQMQQQTQMLQQQLVQQQQANQMLLMKVQKNTQDFLTGKQMDNQTKITIAQMQINAGQQSQVADIVHESEMQQNDLMAEAMKENAKLTAELQKPIAPPVPNTVTINNTKLEPAKPDPYSPLAPWQLQATLPGNEFGGILG